MKPSKQPAIEQGWGVFDGTDGVPMGFYLEHDAAAVAAKQRYHVAAMSRAAYQLEVTRAGGTRGGLGPHAQSLGSSELLWRLAHEPMAEAARERIAKQQARMAAALRDLACTAELHPDHVACDAGPLLREGSWNLPRCTHVTFAWVGIERRYCVELKRLRAAGRALRKYRPELVFDESGVCLRWTHSNGLRGGLTFWGNEHPSESLVIKVPLAAAIDMRSRGVAA